MRHRYFVGYGEHPPRADWPAGARVAVSRVLNVEEGSERAISQAIPAMSRSTYVAGNFYSIADMAIFPWCRLHNGSARSRRT